MRILFLFVSLLLSQTIYAENNIPIPIQGRLDNGLRYIILPIEGHKERVNVIMRVYAGAIDENDAQSGGAHMLEHMAFRTSKNYPNGVMPYLHSQGWLRGKNYNAFTTHDHTTYLYLPPKSFGLEKTLDVMRDMLFYADITSSDLDDERKIVLEEWRSRDSVRRRLWEKQMDSSRINSRYEHRPVIGTEKSITEMPAIELQRYYQQWYVPNNMQLLIAGDINIEKTTQLIHDYFSGFKRKELPDRTQNYDPILEDKLRIDLIQDQHNNRSQVSYLFRFDDKAIHQQTEEGFYQRLIDQVTLAALNQRFRDEKANLPDNIATISARKSPIGKSTSLLMFNASIEKQSHHQGIKFILKEIERFKRHPFTQLELDKQIIKIQEQLKNEKFKEHNYTFDDWVQLMINSLLNNKHYYTYNETVRLTEQGLNTLTLKDINQRLNEWLSAADQIVQYMPPFNTYIEPINADMINKWKQDLQRSQLTAANDKFLDEMRLPTPVEQGKIIAETRFPEKNVVRWQFSNGDTLVWLKTPLAKSKSYFVAQSHAGAHAKQLENWKSKFALRMIGYNAPLNWSHNQMQEWKERYQIPLIMRQSFNRLTILSTVENSELSKLLRFYRANQIETSIKEDFERTKTDLIRQIQLNELSSDFQRNLTWENFVYQKALNPQPTITDVEDLTQNEIEMQWKMITQSPVTYFMVNDLNEEEVKTAVLENLSAIPRGEHLVNIPLTIQTGNANSHFAHNPEYKDHIYLALVTPMKWDLKQALTAELLTVIASEKLGKILRDEALGVYGVRFRTRLAEEAEQLQTTLSFTANPEKSETLLRLAKNQLADLAESISVDELRQAKQYLIEQNENSAKSVDYWLENLIFNENHFGTPYYLGQENTVLQSIGLDEIRHLARAMYNEQNQRLFITTPKHKMREE